MPIEEYSEEEIGLCITILETFISEEPSLVAPLLPEILLSVSRIARNPQYSWEIDSSSFVPSNARSIARQVSLSKVIKFLKIIGGFCKRRSKTRK